MARKKKDGRQPSKYGSPYQPKPSGSTGPAHARPVYSAGAGQGKQGSPALWIIGACAVVAGVAALGSCSEDAGDDPGVTVRRASYASLADCEADWETSNDCESVPLETARSVGSSALDAPASEVRAADGSTASGGGSHGYFARWYGPYYTESGTVYHADGTQTRRDMSAAPARPMLAYDGDGRMSPGGWAGATPRAAMVEEATVRRSALGRGRAMGLSMRTAAATRAPVVSRGGFASRFGGGSGRSGGG